MIVTRELLDCVNLFQKTLKDGDYSGAFTDAELRMICEWKYALSLEFNSPIKNRVILVATDDTSVDTIKNVLALQSKTVQRLPEDKIKILSLVVDVPESDCDINITVQKPAVEKSSDKNVDVDVVSCSYVSDSNSDDDSDDDDFSDDDDNFTIIVNEKRLPFQMEGKMHLPEEKIRHPQIINETVDSCPYT